MKPSDPTPRARSARRPSTLGAVAWPPLIALLLASAGASVTVGCGPAFDPAHPPRALLADKWFKRAEKSYRAGDIEDAHEAFKSALQAAPHDPEIRTLGARIALARLELPEVLRLTEGLTSSDVMGLRGRAHWYAGDIEQAADDLEATVQDPSVKDPWAREVSKLARRGTGRHPFALEGALVAAVDMPKAGPIGLVPCELEGERIVALLSTGVGELIVDSSSRRESAWVNLTFGDRDKLEVKDVPALVEDLSGISHQLGLPVKALLGVNLLRHMHMTFDRHGDQFVVRRLEPTPPPQASRVPLWYLRGGAAMMHISVSPTGDDIAPLLVDTAALFPLSLGDAEWRRAGVDPQVLEAIPGSPNLRGGTVPQLKFGAFDLPKIPAVEDVPHPEQDLGVNMGGVMGSGLLSIFRITFGDEGRFMWIEPDPSMLEAINEEAAGRRAVGRSQAPGPSAPPSSSSSPPTAAPAKPPPPAANPPPAPPKSKP